MTGKTNAAFLGTTKMPFVTFTVNGKEYSSKGEAVNVAGIWKITGTSWQDWKLWIYASGFLKFKNVGKHTFDICAVGAGGKGNVSATGTWTEYYDPAIDPNAYYYDYNYRGSGGGGGEVVTKSGVVLAKNKDYEITIPTESATRFSDIVSANKGDDAYPVDQYRLAGEKYQKGGQSLHSVYCRNTGETTYPKEQTGAEDGVYAFEDSEFDGILYAPGGGNIDAQSYDVPGAGGKGHATTMQPGIKGLMMMRVSV